MSHQEPSDEVLEQAALYALGALEGQEKEALEQLVAEGGATSQSVKDFQNVTSQLGASIKPMAPPSSLRATLMERIAKDREADQHGATSESVEDTADTGLTFVRSTDDLWQEIMPGVLLKPLSFDKTQGRMTALARMAPRTNYAAHRHTAAEEFYVLEGTCFCGGQLLHPGDYHRAEIGSVHAETSSEDGCLMLIIFSPNNEMLESVKTS